MENRASGSREYDGYLRARGIYQIGRIGGATLVPLGIPGVERWPHDEARALASAPLCCPKCDSL